jgi:two-component system OmpR family sensor kinase
VLAEPVELGQVARSLTDELEHLATSSEHELEADVAGQVWSLGDEQRVAQIGRALVVNALVHTPPATRVRLSARSVGDRAVLRVEDDGPGIPPALQGAVFERFYRIEGGRASGSGLGLAIGRELARLMGGDVRLESAPGRTTFTLDLPRTAPPRGSARFSRENGARAGAAEVSS